MKVGLKRKDSYKITIEVLQGYDNLLKEAFGEGILSLFRVLFNKKLRIKRNLNVELSLKRFAGFIFETVKGDLYHIEFQVKDDELMPIQMLENFVSICSKYRKFPKQFVLYLENENLTPIVLSI